jgi:hypothetical protein
MTTSSLGAPGQGKEPVRSQLQAALPVPRIQPQAGGPGLPAPRGRLQGRPLAHPPFPEDAVAGPQPLPQRRAEHPADAPRHAGRALRHPHLAPDDGQLRQRRGGAAGPMGGQCHARAGRGRGRRRDLHPGRRRMELHLAGRGGEKTGDLRLQPLPDARGAAGHRHALQRLRAADAPTRRRASSSGTASRPTTTPSTSTTMWRACPGGRRTATPWCPRPSSGWRTTTKHRRSTGRSSSLSSA